MKARRNNGILQKMFNIMVIGLRRQNKKSKMRGYCKYRGARGCKCAVGWLIPDKFYFDELEQYSTEMIILHKEDLREEVQGIQRLFAASGMTDENMIKFLSQARDIHDGESVESWEPAFHNMADDWDLEYPVE